MKTIFSGIQPSGNLHIGNYIGALSQWVGMQNQESVIRNQELIFCIVDLHAITVPQDPKVLRKKILEVTALYIASGIDPEKAHIFVQSENPDHTYLAWILDCIAPFGQVSRMTQLQDKARRIVLKWKDEHEEVVRQKTLSEEESDLYLLNKINVGLLNYPILMAADILLYDTDEVPVGEDQKQHIEFTRDIAEKFNKTFGQVFKLPEPLIQKETARIMSLQNPLSKMSKSDKDPMGTINLLDKSEEIREKVKRAVTDSGSEIVRREDKPAISNLLTIYSSVSNRTIQELEEQYKGKGYGEFKNDLSDAIVNFLSLLQEKYHRIRKDESYLNKILDEGRDFAISKSSIKIKQVNEAVGLGR